MPSNSICQYDYEVNHENSSVTLKVKTGYNQIVSELEKRNLKLEAVQAVMATFQTIVEQEEFFVASNPDAKLGKFLPETDFEYTVTFQIVIPPIIDTEEITQELAEALDEDDLDDPEAVKTRLFDLIEKRVTANLPEEYLKGGPNPIEAIQSWKRTIGICGLRKTWEQSNTDQVVGLNNLSKNQLNAMVIDQVINNGLSLKGL